MTPFEYYIASSGRLIHCGPLTPRAIAMSLVFACRDHPQLIWTRHLRRFHFGAPPDDYIARIEVLWPLLETMEREIVPGAFLAWDDNARLHLWFGRDDEDEEPTNAPIH